MPLRFSVTQPSQFTFKPTPIVPGNIDMAGSVFKDYPYNQEVKGINQVLTPQEQLELFLQQEGGDIDPNDVNRFAPQGIFPEL